MVERLERGAVRARPGPRRCRGRRGRRWIAVAVRRADALRRRWAASGRSTTVAAGVEERGGVVEGLVERHRRRRAGPPPSPSSSSWTTAAGASDGSRGSTTLRATLGCSRRRSASSASTRLATSAGRCRRWRAARARRVGGEGLEAASVAGRRRVVRRREQERLGERVADQASGRAASTWSASTTTRCGAEEGEGGEPVRRRGRRRQRPRVPTGADAELVGEDGAPARHLRAELVEQPAPAERVGADLDVGEGEHRRGRGTLARRRVDQLDVAGLRRREQRVDRLRAGGDADGHVGRGAPGRPPRRPCRPRRRREQHDGAVGLERGRRADLRRPPRRRAAGRRRPRRAATIRWVTSEASSVRRRRPARSTSTRVHALGAAAAGRRRRRSSEMASRRRAVGLQRAARTSGVRRCRTPRCGARRRPSTGPARTASAPAGGRRARRCRRRARR